jgi:hypothetical protein
MTERWRDLDAAGRQVAQAVFVALDGARGLTDARVRPRPSVSAIWSALASGRPLPVGLVADDDLDALLAEAALVAFPRSAAAATAPTGVDRRVDGARIRVTASLGAPGQSYLTLSFEDAAVAAARLIALVDGAEPVELALPPAVAGAVQVLLDNSDPILVALTDDEARLYLV